MEGKRKAPQRPGLKIPRRSKPLESASSINTKPVARIKTTPLKPLEPSGKPLEAKAVSGTTRLNRKQKRALKKAQKQSLKKRRQDALKILESDNFLEPNHTYRGLPPRKTSNDIGSIWQEQTSIRRADELLEQEYKAAKEKSKALKRKIKQRNKEDDEHALKSVLGPDRYAKIQRRTIKAKIIATKAGLKLQPVTNTVKKPRLILPHIGRKPLMMVGATALVLAGSAYGVNTALHHRKHTAVEGASTNANIPSVTPIYPSGNKPNDKSIKYDAQRKSYTFKDTIDGAALTVTQQGTPEGLYQDNSRFTSLAASVGANESIPVKRGKAYLGTTTDPLGVGQRVVYVTENNLIFIQAETKFKADKWASYLDSLQ